MSNSGDGHEDLLAALQEVGVCGECGAGLTLALAAAIAAGERVIARCEQCGKEQEVGETARISALLVFVARLQCCMAAPQVEDAGDQANRTRFLLLTLAVARLVFAHVVEELRARGAPALKNNLVQAQTALSAAAVSLDEPGCRRILLLFGIETDQELAHYTRATLAFSSYQRYTRGLFEGDPVTAVAMHGTKTSRRPDPELVHVHDELCAGTYRELHDAVCALCLAFLARLHLHLQSRRA